MRHKPQGQYPKDWKDIAKQAKERAGWKCERCGAENNRHDGHVLTVHHLDGNKSNCQPWNLAVLCQRCHLHIQGRVFLPQSYMFEHSTWFIPHVEGYLKSLKENENAEDKSKGED